MITVVVTVAAAIVAVIAMVVCAMFTRRTEAAAQRGKTAAVNARQDSATARNLLQQTQGLVQAYGSAPAPILKDPPKCPLDGAPLASYDREEGKPAIFVHQDGSRHYDRLAELPAGKVAPPPVFPANPDPYAAERGNPLFQPQQQSLIQPPARESTVDSYFQRVSTGIEAGLIDPDALRTGVAHITRNDFDPTATLAPNDPPSQPSQPQPRRRMPDPARATRVAGARRRPPSPTPPPTNGDGS